MQHTQEPWTVGTNHPCRILKVGTTCYPCDEGTETDKEKANALRIVACVNACAGMEDPAAELRQLRAALREACQYIPDGSVPMDVARRLTVAQGLPCPS